MINMKNMLSLMKRNERFRERGKYRAMQIPEPQLWPRMTREQAQAQKNYLFSHSLQAMN